METVSDAPIPPPVPKGFGRPLIASAIRDLIESCFKHVYTGPQTAYFERDGKRIVFAMFVCGDIPNDDYPRPLMRLEKPDAPSANEKATLAAAVVSGFTEWLNANHPGATKLYWRREPTLEIVGENMRLTMRLAVD